MNHCPICGKRIKGDVTHCPNCGTNLYSSSQGYTLSDGEIPIKVKKKRFSLHHIVLIAIIVVFAISFVIFKAIREHRNSSNVADVMVEDYVFRNAIGQFDQNGQALKTIIYDTLNVKDEVYYDEEVDDKKKSVEYYGSFDLKNGANIYYSYNGNKETPSCSLWIDYENSYDDLENFEEFISSIEKTIVKMVDVVSTDPILQDEMHSAIMEWFSLFKESKTTDNYIQVGKHYCFVEIDSNDDEYVFELSFTVENCEVVYK